MKELAPEIDDNTFDSHSIQLLVRPYALPDDYWEVSFDANQAIKKAFRFNESKMAHTEGIEIGNIGE